MHSNMEKPQTHYAERKKPDTKDSVLYETLEGKSLIYSDRKISSCLGPGMGGVHQEGVQGGLLEWWLPGYIHFLLIIELYT